MNSLPVTHQSYIIDQPYVVDQLALEPSPAMDGVIETTEIIDTRSWLQIIIANSEEAMQTAINETSETHCMLIQLKSILAIIKHRMNKKKNSDQAEYTLANLRLNCEKQVSTMAYLLRLRLDKTRDEETRFDMVLRYAELWRKNNQDRATVYEKMKVVEISAEFDGLAENGMTLAREAEIDAAVAELKALAIGFQIEGQALQAS